MYVVLSGVLYPLCLGSSHGAVRSLRFSGEIVKAWLTRVLHAPYATHVTRVPGYVRYHPDLKLLCNRHHSC